MIALALLCRTFQSIEKNCKVEGGYAGTGDVTSVPTTHDDTMQVGMADYPPTSHLLTPARQVPQYTALSVPRGRGTAGDIRI